LFGRMRNGRAPLVFIVDEERMMATPNEPDDRAARAPESRAALEADGEERPPAEADGEEPSPSEAAGGEPSPSEAAGEEPSPSEAAGGEPSPSEAAGEEPSPSEAAGEEEAPPEAAGEEVDDREALDLPLENVVEALLMSAPEPKTARELARAAGRRVRSRDVAEAVDNLNATYAESRRAFEIVCLGERYQFMTRPEYGAYVRYLVDRGDEPRRLSPAARDTLAIIAYKQPVLRVDIETIRGVSCGPVLRHLIELGLVKVVGKQTDTIGHPLLYGTTQRFLEQFGIGSLDELPNIPELQRP